MKHIQTEKPWGAARFICKVDTILLADIFENFGRISMEYYELDPCHFYTAPGLTWSAALKMTGVELELLKNPDMSLLVDEGMRGGISQISNRYAKSQQPIPQRL